MSELKVNKISPRSGTAVTLGDSGDTFTIPSGATLAIQGTVSGFTSAGIDDNATSVAITISSAEDVTFTENILLGDSKKAIFGAGSDLEIFHNGSNSFVKDVGSGALILDTNGTDVRITKSDAEFMAKFVTDGAVELYHDNSKKFETTSTGATITGNITATGNLTSLGIDDNATSTAITIDSSENVGIGTASPATTFHVDSTSGIRLSSSAAAIFDMYGGFANSKPIRFFVNTDTQNYAGIRGLGSSAGLSFETGVGVSTAPSERMRIDSSGNLLVGTTSSFGSSGITLGSNVVYSAGSSQNVANFQRYGSDGEIIRLGKAGTTVGSIGIQSGGLTVDGETNHSGIRFSASSFLPRKNNADVDGTVDLGTTDGRWKDLYLGGGAFLGGTGTANKLDDYEEGTWTPTFLGSGVNPTQTYSTRNGIYVKIGKMVHCQIQIYLNNGGITSGTGTAYLGGLPFTASATAQGSMGSTYYANNWLTSGGGNGAPIGMFLENNQNQCFLVGNDSYSGSRSGSAGTFITAQSFGNFTFLVGSISYQTDA